MRATYPMLGGVVMLALYLYITLKSKRKADVDSFGGLRRGSMLFARLGRVHAPSPKRRGAPMSAGKINNGRPQSASLHVHLTNSGAHPEPSSPHGNSGPHGGQRLHATLSWQHLVGVTFFAVCGGDYGLEETVGAAGPA